MTVDDLLEEIKTSMTVAQGSFFKRPWFGHRFGELRNAVASEDTQRRIYAYAKECLQWMVDLAHAKAIAVTVSYDGASIYHVSTDIVAPDGRTVSFSRFVEVGRG